MEEILEKIGLTNSESKVYLALIRLGASSAGPLINEAGVSSSKIYELLDKLIEKGLVTTYSENNKKYYKSVDPKRLKYFLNEKKEELKKKESELKKIMPELERSYREKRSEIEVELFKGYKGVSTAFNEILNRLRSGDEFLVIGGGDKPSFNPRTKLFFDNFHNKRSKRGIKLRIIFSEERKKLMKDMRVFPHTTAKYLSYGTPSTINIYRDTTLLLTMSPVPAVIRIKDAKITESYRLYFENMWKIAKR